MNLKPTPGPYAVERDHYGSLTGCIYRKHASLDGPAIHQPQVALAMRPDDAPLLAASWKLLAALKLAKAILAREAQVPEGECVGDHFVQINAAISEAEGGGE